MPSLKLTQSAIEKIAVPKVGQVLYRDTDKKGLAVRVTPSGKKSFVVDKWRKEKGRVARIVICDVGDLTVFQAQKQADKLIGQLATGTNPIDERRKRLARGVSLGEVFEAYLKARKNLAARTIADYRRIVYVSLQDWTERPIAGIGKDDIETRHSNLGEKSPAHANYVARLLRALFNFASDKYGTDDEPFLTSNPVKRLNSAKAWYRVCRRQTYIKPTQLKVWFEALESEEQLTRDLFHVLILTGLRRGEASRLSWKYIDLHYKTLTVPDPKNHQPHTLPLSDFLLALFKRRKASNSGAWVFPGTGSTGHFEEPKKAVARVAEASGVAFSCHDLRRTFITVAESLDISAYAVKRLANHKTKNDVTSGYIMVDVERLREPMQRITDFMLKTAGVKKSADVVRLRKKA